MMKKKLLISACLCGKNTKYSGGNNLISNLKLVEENFELFLICPEVMGGLSTPRDPSEIQGNGVYSDKGKNVTKEFKKGANIALDIALKEDIHIALMKESSPSCGKNKIHDGSFTGRKINGQGVTAKLLSEHKIRIYNENEVELLLKKEL